jgi:PAS domain S-box-containing protein
MHSQSTPSFDASPASTSRPPSEDGFTAAVRGARLPMLVTAGRERDYAILYVNDGFTALTGYSREESLGRNPRFLQGPDTAPAAVQTLRAALDEGREAFVEILNYRRDGAPFWNGMFISPLRSANGEITGWFGSQLDVTGRKAAEQELAYSKSLLEAAVEQRTEHLRSTAEQKDVLLHEVEHRVKNNLQLISSLIQFQARRTQDPAVRSALKLLQGRVSAVSTAHRRLFQTDDAGCFDVGRFLGDLVDDLIGRTGRPDIIVRLSVEPMAAPAIKAAPLALVLHEILGLAVSEGLPPGRGGSLDIRLQALDAGFAIRITDDGMGTAESRRAALGGPTGIAEILRRQLGGRIEWSDNQPGVVALITLPDGSRPLRPELNA